MIALILNATSRYDKENHGINLGPAGDLCRETFAKHGIDYDDAGQVWTTYASDFFGGHKPNGKVDKIIFAGANNLQHISRASG